jgi:hypothetical protein
VAGSNGGGIVPRCPVVSDRAPATLSESSMLARERLLDRRNAAGEPRLPSVIPWEDGGGSASVPPGESQVTRGRRAYVCSESLAIW